MDPLYVAQIAWQQSTDLLTKDDITLMEYSCDTTQSACRVNLAVTPLLDNNSSPTLTCNITADFDLTPSLSNPCNPNQSIVPIGVHSITIEILQKSTGALLTTRTITIHNTPPNTSIDPVRVMLTLAWQNTTHLTEKVDGTLAEYFCDSTRSSCSINPEITPLLDGVASTLLICSFVSDIDLTPTSDPCNPNTSTVPSGDHTLSIEIREKSTGMLLVTRPIMIHGLAPVIPPDSVETPPENQ